MYFQILSRIENNDPAIESNKQLNQAWIDAMNSNKEKDEQIRILQQEVILKPIAVRPSLRRSIACGALVCSALLCG